MQLCLVSLVGFFSGRLVDLGYIRHCIFVGCGMQIVGVFTTSVSTTYWQLFLAQGVCSGLGHGFLYAPIVSILPTYFKRRRAIAMALATCGSATGGLVFPAIAYSCLKTLGFRLTVIIMGVVVTFNSVLVVTFTKAHIAPRKARTLFNFTPFCELPFTLFAVATWLVSWSVYFAYFYVRISQCLSTVSARCLC